MFDITNLFNKTVGFLEKGGFIMWPIIVCSIIAFAIAIERFIFIRKRQGSLKKFLFALKPLIQARKITDAIEICKLRNNSISSVARAILENADYDRERMESVADEVITVEIPMLEKHIGIIGIVAAIAPLLGLLGTVTGMIKAFFLMAKVNLGDPSALAGGISEALITTAFGMIVAIPSIVCFNFLSLKINTISWDMEILSKKLINFLHQQQEKVAKNGEKNNAKTSNK